MSDIRLRLQIARRAAQLMYAREEKEYFTAKRKAAREFGVSARVAWSDLPSNREIRDEIQRLALFYEGDARFKRLTDMRLAALRFMKAVEPFHPHLIGSVLTGYIREGSDVDIHIFTNSLADLTETLDGLHRRYSVEHKRVQKFNEERVFTHVHLDDRPPIELTVYPLDKLNYPFKSSITGRRIERASIEQLERLLRESDPTLDLDAALQSAEDYIDAYQVYRDLLLPLEDVKQDPRWHPEGDALYHSLQVFELARAERTYDVEFLLAALLHDVGKAIDPADHVGAGLLALEGTITARTEFLIARHMDIQAYHDGRLGPREVRALKMSPDLDDLLRLGELDQQGREPGVVVCTVDEALAYIREAEAEYQ